MSVSFALPRATLYGLYRAGTGGYQLPLRNSIESPSIEVLQGLDRRGEILGAAGPRPPTDVPRHAA